MTGKIIEINEEKIKQHLGEFVRETVEETLRVQVLTAFSPIHPFYHEIKKVELPLLLFLFREICEIYRLFLFLF